MRRISPLTLPLVLLLMGAGDTMKKPPPSGGGGSSSPVPTGPMELRWGDAGPSSPAAPVDYRPITEAEGPYRPSPAPIPASGYLCRHGDLGRSGRLSRGLATGPYLESFRRDANHWEEGSAVLASGKRIFSDAPQWALFDSKGKPLAEGTRGWGPAHLDPERKAIYLPFRSPDLSVFEEVGLKRGKPGFQNVVSGSGRPRYPLLTRVKKTYLAVVSDEFRHPHGGSRPNETVVNTFGPPPSRQKGTTLRLNRSAVQVALRDQRLVLAGEESLLFVTVGGLPASLAIEAAYSAPFEPQSLSLDEDGRAHLLVRVEGKSELWIVDAEGHRLQREVLGRELQPVQPPVIGFDHRIFLIEADRITALKDGGGIAWHHPARKVAGATITPDGILLVAADRELLAFAADGSRRVVHTLTGSEDEHLRTAPVLTSDGTLLLGTTIAVVALKPKG